MLSLEARRIMRSMRYDDDFGVFEMNFEEWVEGKKPYLYVMGLSGSGKSTYGHAISHMFDSDYIELDEIEQVLIKRYGLDALKAMEERMFYGLYIDQVKRQSKRAVVEGLQLLYINPSFFNEEPVVILNTSYIASTFRAWMRDKDRRFKLKGLDVIRNNLEFNRKLKAFIEFYRELNTIND